MAAGGGCAALYLLLPFVYHGPDLLPTNLTIASLAAVCVSLGFALTHHSVNSLRGRPSRVFRPPSAWPLALIFIPCLLLGQAMISLLRLSPLTSLAFPPVHVMVAVTPALLILAFVGRRMRAGSWRTVSLEVSHGAILAPAAALAAELITLFVLALVISLVVALTPGGVDRLLELSVNLQDPAWLEDPTNLARLVLSPAVLAMIVIIFVIIAPLVEEFLKGLGVLLLGYRLRGKAEALLWGVACGAGFALGESLFNGAIALETWGMVMLMRWGATLMHCVGSGIMGLGWYEALVEKRPWRFLATYAASAGIHALWNGAAVSVAIPSLLMVTRPDDVLAQGITGLVVLGFLAFLLLLTLSMIVVLLYLMRTASGPRVEDAWSDEGNQVTGEP